MKHEMRNGCPVTILDDGSRIIGGKPKVNEEKAETPAEVAPKAKPKSTAKKSKK